ncbi:MAG: DUF2948 family protein [Henriciella sp.]|jgi:hypothetical protein
MGNEVGLRLLAHDPEDLEVISSALQDAVLKAEHLRYDARRRSFHIEMNRYRWERPAARFRTRSLLSVDGVTRVRTRAVSRRDPDMIYSLLSMTFKPAADPPGGQLCLLFAGDGEIELTVEALDVTLFDSSYEWPARDEPDHDRKR